MKSIKDMSITDNLNKTIFVTGFPRSGTTLVDRLLNSNQAVSLFSQPLPLLFVNIKRVFLKHLQESSLYQGETNYPLSDLQFSNWYPISSFNTYLDEQVFEKSFYKKTLLEMVDYSGQSTKPKNLNGILDKLKCNSLNEFLLFYIQMLSSNPENDWLGLKEISCEEYIPWFLKQNAKVFLVVRDPRDAIASANFVGGNKFIGKQKPLLFNIRQWRKSVQFALQFKQSKSLYLLQYEKLTRNPEHELRLISNFLNYQDSYLSPPDIELKDHEGKPWKANSSFGNKSGIDASSVGKYKDLLSGEELRTIEACCWPELNYMGYDLSITQNDVENIIRHGFAQEQLGRGELSSYMFTRASVDEELERWGLLSGKLARSKESNHFVFKNTLEDLQLASAMKCV